MRLPLHMSRILVVDDHAVNRRLLTDFLFVEGFTNVDTAADGIEALERIAVTQPDLVILDIMMPRLNGIEVCRRLRAAPETQTLPVLVQTALGSTDDRAAIFAAGATDLVTKPIAPQELLARVRIHLENRLLLRNLQVFHDRVADELAVASRMQMELLPTRDDVQRIERDLRLRLSAHLQPSTEVGGDLWTIIPLPGHRLGVFAGDLSGHGVVASLNAFRLHVMLDDLGGHPDIAGSPAAMLQALNERLAGLLSVGQFATAFYAVIDRGKETIRYSAAAWEAAYLHSPGRGMTPLTSPGLPLGVDPNEHYPEHEIACRPGETLLSFSDALLSLDGTGRTSENQKMVERWCLEALDDRQDLIRTIRVRLLQRGIEQLEDDLTIIAVTLEA